MNICQTAIRNEKTWERAVHCAVFRNSFEPAFTYLNIETELFKVVNVPMCDDMRKYVEIATKTAKDQKEYFTGPLGNDVLQCSPMPWLKRNLWRLLWTALQMKETINY